MRLHKIDQEATNIIGNNSEGITIKIGLKEYELNKASKVLRVRRVTETLMAIIILIGI